MGSYPILADIAHHLYCVIWAINTDNTSTIAMMSKYFGHNQTTCKGAFLCLMIFSIYEIPSSR